jgi:hypothetical protein
MSGIFDQIINYSPPLIVSGTVNYKGTWDASTNNPTLNNPPATSTKGDYYVVSTAGTQFTISFAVGDWIISSGTAWEKVDLTDAVSSVFGRTGAVVGVSTDYSAVGLTNTAIGASSPSTGAFTTVSASTPIAVASGGTGVSTSTGTTNVVLSNSPTIVTPVIAQINDASGNETLKLASIASAVNEISIENAATGNPVHIRATGGDASVGLHLVAKGASGYVNVTDGVDETKRIMFNAAGGTTNTRTMLSSTQTVDRTISLPDATGTLLYGGGPLGTPSSGTVTNLTGTASININGTVGATTASTGAFTTLTTSDSGYVQATFQRTGGNGPLLFLKNYSSTAFKNWFIGAGYNGEQLEFMPSTAAGGSTVGATVAAISSTGLAVTGALSSTTGANFATSSGNVGIGTTSPATQLDVSSNTGTEIITRRNGGRTVNTYADATNAIIAYSTGALRVGETTSTVGANFTERLRVDSSGNLLVGVTSAAAEGGFTLYPQGSSGAPLLVWNRATTVNSTTAADFRNGSSSVGNITYTNTTTLFTNLSDYRRKSNVKDLIGSGAFIDALKPRTFDWDTGDKGVGFIAHEFAEVSPTSVSGEKDAVDSDGKPVYQAMQASSAEVIANLVAEIQSLRQRVAGLETK